MKITVTRLKKVANNVSTFIFEHKEVPADDNNSRYKSDYKKSIYSNQGVVSTISELDL